MSVRSPLRRRLSAPVFSHQIANICLFAQWDIESCAFQVLTSDTQIQSDEEILVSFA